MFNNKTIKQLQIEKYNGEYTWKFKNRRNKKTLNFLNGKKDGFCIYYFDNKNNSIKKKCEYNNDKLEGKYQEYYSNNHLKCEMNYVKGKKHGKYQRWFRNGKLFDESNYTNGKEDIEDNIEYNIEDIINDNMLNDLFDLI